MKRPARFVVDIVDHLDVSHMVAACAGTGSKPYRPALLVATLCYGYATGVFSSRKLTRASDDSIAFGFIRAHTHPGHREALSVYLTDPDVPIDTNHLERGLRPIPMGRRTASSPIGAIS